MDAEISMSFMTEYFHRRMRNAFVAVRSRQPEQVLGIHAKRCCNSFQALGLRGIQFDGDLHWAIILPGWGCRQDWFLDAERAG